ncbi:stage II sporulation protein E [Caldanaerovirga acetigignens]|uniref:Stage II sporulation protein E n=1 Tax=Caldanaerovirga acetigignens TaxID=447595 RepID=A0A1M7KU12_9FIRM|nr:stage II sporulation protein E [Caldanaerovirga acetigignens]
MINRTKIHKAYLAVPQMSLAVDSMILHVAAFFLGRVPILEIYPLGISITAAAAFYRGKFLTVGIASLLGTFTAAGELMAVKYFAATTIFTIIYSMLRNKVKNRDLLVGVCVLVSSAGSGILMFTMKSASLYDYLLILMEAGLSFIFFHVIPYGLPGLFKSSSTKIEKSLCLILMAGGVLRVMSFWEFFNINLKEALSAVVALVSSAAGGPGAGAAAGAMLGIMGNPSSAASWSAGALAFSGMVGGAFCNLGKYGVAAGFALGYIFLNLYAGFMGEAAIRLPSLIFGLCIFLLLPEKLLENITKYVYVKETEDELAIKREIFKDRLYEVARLFDDLSRALILPPGNIKEQGFFEKFYQKVKSEICEGCRTQRTCWEKEYKATVRALYEILKCEKGLYHSSELVFFKCRCEKIEEIKGISRYMNNAKEFEVRIEGIIKKQRDIMVNNFKGTAKIIRTLADGAFPEGTLLDVEERIKSKLSELGAKVDHVYAIKNADKLQVNIVKSPCIKDNLCEREIPECIKEAVGTEVLIKVVGCPLRSGSTKCRLKAIPKGNYRVSVGVVSLPEQGAEVSGDSFSFVELESGNFMLAISDGMGGGETARKESERTISLLEELLEAGYDSKNSIDILNSAMQLVRDEDSFSTLDVVLIDTYSGKAEFLKAGAVSSFIKRGRKVEVVKGGALPVGIIDNIEVSSVKKNLKAGDIIVLLSDGALDSFSNEDDKEAAIVKFLETACTSNPQELANMILEKVRENNRKIKDDMTVLVGSIWRYTCSA